MLILHDWPSSGNTNLTIYLRRSSSEGFTEEFEPGVLRLTVDELGLTGGEGGVDCDVEGEKFSAIGDRLMDCCDGG
jgi:hypothetical protein